MHRIIFKNREDAARQLAARLEGLALEDPLVLAIPRGGVVTGAVLAQALGAELDVVLARKLRAPRQPELAIGALGEDGEVYLNELAHDIPGVDAAYLASERAHQAAELERRRRLFRAVRPAAKPGGRTVIVTDDGVATGSTMFAALHVLAAQGPKERIVAVPLAPADTLAELRARCDRVECLATPSPFGAISLFYYDFTQVEDEEALRLLREFRPGHGGSPAGGR